MVYDFFNVSCGGIMIKRKKLFSVGLNSLANFTVISQIWAAGKQHTSQSIILAQTTFFLSRNSATNTTHLFFLKIVLGFLQCTRAQESSTMFHDKVCSVSYGLLTWSQLLKSIGPECLLILTVFWLHASMCSLPKDFFPLFSGGYSVQEIINFPGALQFRMSFNLSPLLCQ